MKAQKFLLGMLLLIAMVLSACGGAAQPAAPAAPAQPAATAAPAQPAATTAPAAGNDKVTITVWDYYGEATPIKPLVEPFMKANPNIIVKYESLDWDTTNQKLNVVLTGGTPPDVVTVDMTWLPKLAALGGYTDLKPLSGGKLNGKTWEDSYTPGGLSAITYNNQIVAALFDFDCYALYYRADLFKQKGIDVPKTWEEIGRAHV
jgi:ABC-type glycerol-3-phosphate transport system substrate-binding protein